jgi:hypothetical protein
LRGDPLRAGGHGGSNCTYDPDSQPPDASTPDAPDADAPDAPDASCQDDLSNIQTGNFDVTLSIATTQVGPAALVNQRHACGHGMFWDVRLAAGGGLRVETDDGTQYTSLVCSHPVNDGLPHVLAVRRDSGIIQIAVDGVTCITGGSTSSFHTLAPLAIGWDPCDGVSGTVAFGGSIQDVCVSYP